MHILIAKLVPKIRFEKHTGTVCPPDSVFLSSAELKRTNRSEAVGTELAKDKNNRFWRSVGHEAAEEAADHQVLRLLKGKYLRLILQDLTESILTRFFFKSHKC